MPLINASSTDDQLMALAVEIVEAVKVAIATPANTGLTGKREGQYGIDVVANNVALKILQDANVPVLSEESGVDGVTFPLRDDDIFAIVDPLDGSTNADRGLGWYSTSVAIVDSEGLRIAVVANQVNGDTFTATRGGGAFRNGDPIRVASSRPLGECVVGISGLPRSSPGWWQFRALGSAALDLCLVASGALDAWLDCESHGVWDYAGGVLIVREAGGFVSEVFGEDLIHASYDARRTIVAASSRDVHDALIAARRKNEPQVNS